MGRLDVVDIILLLVMFACIIGLFIMFKLIYDDKIKPMNEKYKREKLKERKRKESERDEFEGEQYILDKHKLRIGSLVSHLSPRWFFAGQIIADPSSPVEQYKNAERDEILVDGVPVLYSVAAKSNILVDKWRIDFDDRHMMLMINTYEYENKFDPKENNEKPEEDDRKEEEIVDDYEYEDNTSAIKEVKESLEDQYYVSNEDLDDYQYDDFVTRFVTRLSESFKSKKKIVRNRY